MRLEHEIRQHVSRVTALVRDECCDPTHLASDRLLSSWRRSLERHRVDPSLASLPRILSSSEVRDHRERLDSFLRIARHGVARLHEQVRDSRYCVLLTDGDGVTIDLRGVPALDREFEAEGFRIGTCWSEREEGTCGVGTSIVDRAPTLVHKTEHFRAHNIAFTCSSAPIFGPNDDLMGILDASALSCPDDRASQALVFQLVAHNARLVESAFFVDSFRAHWILQLSRQREFLDVEMDVLVAFDDAGRVAGANRRARSELFARLPFTPARLQEVFDLPDGAGALLDRARAGAPLPLRFLATGERLFALVRAPARSVARPAQRAADATAGAQPGDLALRGFGRIEIGDRQMAQNVERARRLVDSKIPILLQGETGTGKDVFARALHEHSARRDKAFVALNCAAIPESLIESELFGYRDGAFTGARARGTKGKIALSHGGTLFLDEIGDMPLHLQTRLLRVLADGEVLPLGAGEPEHVDLNVICATHRDIVAMVRQGRFREDLFYRLSGAVFHLPALRERTDVPALVERLFREEARQAGKEVVLPDELLEFLTSCSWPGNVRQLRNALRYAIAVADGAVLAREHLPREVTEGMHRVGRLRGYEEPLGARPPMGGPPHQERDVLVAALKRNSWNVAGTARDLGIGRATMYRKMSRHQIVLPNWIVQDD